MDVGSVSVVRMMWSTAKEAASENLAMLIAVLTSIPLLIFVLMKRHFSFWSSKKIPGPEPNLLTGNYNDLVKDSHLTIHKKWIDRYGKLLGFWEFTKPKLMVADPDLIKKMLVQDFNSIVDRRTDGFDHPLEILMAVFQDGDDWRKSRALMTPAFSSAKFKSMFDQFTVCCGKQIHYLDELISTGQANDVDAFDLFARYFSDIISRSLFSVSFIDSYDEEDKIERSLNKWFKTNRVKLIISSILPRWFKTKIRFSIFNTPALSPTASMFRRLIDERKAADFADRRNADLLAIMIDSGPGIMWTDDNMIANLILMYLAGYLSSGLLFSFLIYHFAKFPRVVDNIIAELNDLEASGDSLTLETLQKRFVYLDAVISETQRLYPTTTYTERRVSAKEYTFEYNGTNYALPKDTVIYIPIFLVHRDPDNFEEPDKFDETRFLPDKVSSMHPYAFLPFGHGPRNCIGTRFALVSVKLLVTQDNQRLQVHTRQRSGSDG